MRGGGPVVVVAWVTPVSILVAIAACGDDYGESPATTNDADASSSSGEGGEPPGVCGDGKRSGGEKCEGADLGGATCTTAVAPGWIGSPTCTAACVFDTNGCSTPASTYNPVGSPNSWVAFDPTLFNVDAKGFRGGAFDGRYVYFVPYDANFPVGLIARYDTQGGFSTTSSWSAFDVSTVNAGAKGFIGAAFDGRYVYFVPKNNGADDGVVARYDTKMGFGAGDAWSVFDMATVEPLAKGYAGAIFDGAYLYFVPNENPTGHGMMMRLDTRAAASFSQPTSWTSFDITKITANAKGFAGGTFDGRYIYLAPNEDGNTQHGLVVRYDTTSGYREPPSWKTFDVTGLNMAFRGYNGAAFDGRYVYLSPAGHSFIVRHDTKGNFEDRASWESFDSVTADARARGFRGVVFDGQNVYFVPYLNNGYHGVVPRYDTTKVFTSSSAWTMFDVGGLNPNAKGYYGGVFDGRYLYLVPYNGGENGIAVRFDAKQPPWLPRNWNASFY